jgi:hypothetical protein
MTSSITQLPGATTRNERKLPEHGLTVLRQREAQGLISLGIDALSQAHLVGHDIHAAVYDKNASTTSAKLQDQLAEVLTCMETAEHYLLMLGGVIEDRPAPHGEEETGSSPVQ